MSSSTKIPRTFESEKMALPPLKKMANLLPLLQSDPSVKNSITPPIHLFPRNEIPGIESRRIVATIKDSNGCLTRWISTTHLFPAAYPRSNQFSTTPSSRSSDKFVNVKMVASGPEAKAQRSKDLKEWANICEKNPIGDSFPNVDENPKKAGEATRKEAERLKGLGLPQLWSCVERIVPVKDENLEELVDRNDGEGVTLVFAHANGFHKEIWGPTIEELLLSLSKASNSSSPRIDEIWSIDCIDSGDAGAINRETLGDVASWFDHPRDISQLLNHFMPPKPSFKVVKQEITETQAASYPFPPKKKKVIVEKRVYTPDGRSSKGQCWPGTTLKRTREGQGRKGRRFVGIGHSFSGACLAMLSNSEPDLFEAVILLDPVIRPPEGYGIIPVDVPLAIGAVVRKDAWSSRQKASAYYNSKPFFKAWDPRVLSKHLEFGLRPLSPSSPSDGPCTLSMSKWREASAFSLSILGSFAYPALESQKFKGKAYIVTMRQGSIYARDDQIAKRVREANGNGEEGGEMMEGDHLVAQEQPIVLGAKLAEILPKLLNKTEADKKQPEIPRSKL